MGKSPQKTVSKVWYTAKYRDLSLISLISVVLTPLAGVWGLQILFYMKKSHIPGLSKFVKSLKPHETTQTESSFFWLCFSKRHRLTALWTSNIALATTEHSNCHQLCLTHSVLRRIHTKSSSTASWFHSNLFAVRRQQVEAAGRDSEADCHASKLQVTLPQDGGQTARGRLRGERCGTHEKKQTKKQGTQTKKTFSCFSNSTGSIAHSLLLDVHE